MWFVSKFNPYFGWCVLHMYFIPAKVGIKSCRLLANALLVHEFGFGELEQ